ncbi:hypothetical protein [Nesterenkonia populi]|uniref:hypothetical protein n=1 Tax=Nesterenkonia populi TaxID=1591087 RepID=UPI0011BD532F|nr:hypothetical protein [Nesterenkonia populi]
MTPSKLDKLPFEVDGEAFYPTNHAVARAEQMGIPSEVFSGIVVKGQWQKARAGQWKIQAWRLALVLSPRPKGWAICTIQRTAPAPEGISDSDAALLAWLRGEP